jgi:F-type H+-transporting ATPase subunit b
MKALKDREESIDNALHAADQAREEMKTLKSKHEELLNLAKDERDSILRDARNAREKIIEEAKLKAQEEANRIVENAKESIHYEKMAAMTDLKNQIAQLSIEIAEKLLKEELAQDDKQKQLVDKLVKGIEFN